LAKARVIVKRRKSVRNIRKITRTMQLIATARFQAALSRATAAKPYTEKLAEMVGDLSRYVENVEHPLLRNNEDADRVGLVVITSSRGFCGGYNTSLLRTAMAFIDSQPAPVDTQMVGKKGVRYFRFLKRAMAEQITQIGDKPRFSDIEPIANGLMDRYIKGEIRSAKVVYMKFVSAGKQEPTVMQLLPLAYSAEGKGEESAAAVQYEFTPDPATLLAELLPATVRVRLFQAFTEAIASEQIARMAAMKSATEAAGDMIKSLTRQYNRARQTQITMELLDIVGGANALE
jgi:F-type H+-transporting ATPase subunit gamma